MAVTIKPGPIGGKPLLAITVFNAVQGESGEGYVDMEQAASLAAILSRFAETGDSDVYTAVARGYVPKAALHG